MAAARAGLKALEVTYTTPSASDALRALRDALPPNVLLGAGTVVEREQARSALASGASFLVSPHLDEEVLADALAAGADFVPGVITPSEISRALRLGAKTLKLFPIGSSGGLPYLKDLLGPYPALSTMVTGGVTPREVPEYLAAGAVAVGLGSNLFPRAALERGDWAAVEAATRAALLETGSLT